MPRSHVRSPPTPSADLEAPRIYRSRPKQADHVSSLRACTKKLDSVDCQTGLLSKSNRGFPRLQESCQHQNDLQSPRTSPQGTPSPMCRTTAGPIFGEAGSPIGHVATSGTPPQKYSPYGSGTSFRWNPRTVCRLRAVTRRPSMNAHFLEGQVAQNDRLLYPKVTPNSGKVTHDYGPLPFQAVATNSISPQV